MSKKMTCMVVHPTGNETVNRKAKGATTETKTGQCRGEKKEVNSKFESQ